MVKDNTKTMQTIGLDLGDRTSQLCVLDAGGEVVEEPEQTLNDFQRPLPSLAIRLGITGIPACVAEPVSWTQGLGLEFTRLVPREG